MVIDDLDIDRARRALRPLKANPPLIVDADAVLALPIALKRFQPVATDGSKIVQAGCRLQAVKPNFGLS
jgi:hypothetical protein